MRGFHLSLGSAWLTAACAAYVAAGDLGPPLKILQEVGRQGTDNRRAAQAWEQVARADASELTVVLAAVDGAGPLGANWIRTAADAIAERSLRRDGTLRAVDLEQFVLDASHAPRARRAAYEWLLRVDPSARGRLIPGMLEDTSVEMRRDAVAELIKRADDLEASGGAADAAAVYQRAFSAARDVDQIKHLAGRLRDLGHEVNLLEHFGFLVRWKLIGPFDNTDQKGFDVVFEPEREIDIEGTYVGKEATVGWVEHVATDDYGTVDFHKPFGEQKGVVGYGVAEFVSGVRQEVELRLTSVNAVKVWLNGELIGEHEIYHAGSQLDQYVSPAVLRPGRNVILVKVCQNEQTQDWTKHWDFKLRVCDSQGGAILSSEGQIDSRLDARQP